MRSSPVAASPYRNSLWPGATAAHVSDPAVSQHHRSTAHSVPAACEPIQPLRLPSSEWLRGGNEGRELGHMSSPIQTEGLAKPSLAAQGNRLGTPGTTTLVTGGKIKINVGTPHGPQSICAGTCQRDGFNRCDGPYCISVLPSAYWNPWRAVIIVDVDPSARAGCTCLPSTPSHSTHTTHWPPRAALLPIEQPSCRARRKMRCWRSSTPSDPRGGSRRSSSLAMARSSWR